MPDTWVRNAVAEAVGVFALCFVGILAITGSGGGLPAVALAHGLAIACPECRSILADGSEIPELALPSISQAG